jgi:two-component system phosphate regulon sensor histidine kinase PhoR
VTVFSRLKWRLAASYVALFCAVLTALGIHLIGSLRDQQLATLTEQLEREAHLVAVSAEQALAAGRPADLAPLAIRLGADINTRVTLIGPSGEVLGDSDHDPATMDNHGQRPEVLQALASGAGSSARHSATLERDLLYVAVPMRADGRLVGVARVALPVTEISATATELAVKLGTAMAVAALLASVLAAVLARTLTRRVEALTAAARRMAGGDLDRPIEVQGNDEVAQLAAAFDDMARRVRALLDATEVEREQLATIVRHMGDGLVIADARGQVRLVNPAAARLLQLDGQSVEGQPLMVVLRDHELAALIEEVVGGEQPTAGPFLVELGPPQARRSVSATASRLPAVGGRVGEVMLMLGDLTELRRTELLRREFAANVSHELRTPISAIKALVETLEHGALDDPPAARQFLAALHDEVDRLAQIVRELLELFRIETGQTRLQREPTDLGPLLAGIVERLRPLAERHGLELRLVYSPDLPYALADADRIQQVLTNLVHNAIKFTARGWVEIRAERRDGELAISVVDTGRGIPPGDLERIFERFFKTDRSRSEDGAGLGLAIAKHTVQAHGGRIWAESDGRTGSTFSFTLPVAREAPALVS